MKKYIWLMISLLVVYSSFLRAIEINKHASIIIFSFDRPLQLHATLQSIQTFIAGVDEIYILYRTSTSEYADSYEDCFNEFSQLNIQRIKQSDCPQSDFKPLLLDILHNCRNEYIFLLVDDGIAIGSIDVCFCISLIEKYNAYGFYTGLGKNITESYILKSLNPMPQYVHVEEEACLWLFKDGFGEWCYPHGVDRIIFRKQDLIHDFSHLSFSSPGTLEANWDRLAYSNGIHSKTGLCYAQSKIINIPFNMVQRDWQTSYTTPMTAEDCLALYKEGNRIDVSQYISIVPAAPHIDLPLYLIPQVSV